MTITDTKINIIST